MNGWFLLTTLATAKLAVMLSGKFGLVRTRIRSLILLRTKNQRIERGILATNVCSTWFSPGRNDVVQVPEIPQSVRSLPTDLDGPKRRRRVVLVVVIIDGTVVTISATMVGSGVLKIVQELVNTAVLVSCSSTSMLS